MRVRGSLVCLGFSLPSAVQRGGIHSTLGETLCDLSSATRSLDASEQRDRPSLGLNFLPHRKGMTRSALLEAKCHSFLTLGTWQLSKKW